MTTVVSRRVKTGSLLLLAIGVAGAAAIHRATHGIWFGMPAARHAGASAWQSWNRIPIGAPIRGFGGDRPDDVWAWSSSGIMHWDGRRWTRVPGPGSLAGEIEGVSEWFGTLWVRAVVRIPCENDGCDGCIGGRERTFQHDWCRVDGTWKKDLDCDIRRPADTPAPAPAAPPSAIAYLGPKELAPLWSEHASDRSGPWIVLKRGYRVGGGELWAVDESGCWLAHFDGHAWSAEANVGPAFTGPIWLADADHGWALAGNSVFRWDGRDWMPAAAAPERLRSIWGAGADDVWAVGERGLIMHFDGRIWRQERVGGLPTLTSVRGRARDDVWIAGCAPNGLVSHWDGARWTVPSRVPTAGGLRPPNADDCFLLGAEPGGRALAVGSDRQLEYGAGGWSETAGPPPQAEGARVVGTLIAAVAVGDGGAWAVGRRVEQGVLSDGAEQPIVRPFAARRVAGVWTRVDVPGDSGGANAIWARAADDVWVVGSKGLVTHFDGRSWTREESGTDEELVGVHGAGDTMWVVGADGGLLRRRL